jgi:hypothetical protein
MAYRWTQADLDNIRARVKPMPEALVPKVKRSKFNNRKVTDAGGNVHDSTKEFRHWQALQLRELAGEIRHLRRQVPFALVVDGVHVCSYVADFVFEEGAATRVVDCKSPPTRAKPEYRIKLKLMAAIHKIQIHEV